MTNENVSRYKRLTAEERQAKRDADFEVVFLAEVERRAGASREEMLKEVGKHDDLCSSQYESETGPLVCDCKSALTRWLRRILGESK